MTFALGGQLYPGLVMSKYYPRSASISVSDKEPIFIDRMNQICDNSQNVKKRFPYRKNLELF